MNAQLPRLGTSFSWLAPEQVARLVARYWSNVVTSPDPADCWDWKGSVNGKGYGRLSVAGRTVLIHRLSYEIHDGPLTEGLLICHQCDNRRCSNPAHLFEGTHEENMSDMVSKKRSGKRGGKGEMNGNARLTVEQVHEIRHKYATQRTTLKKLGAEYGVHFDTISKLLNGKSWTHC